MRVAEKSRESKGDSRTRSAEPVGAVEIQRRLQFKPNSPPSAAFSWMVKSFLSSP